MIIWAMHGVRLQQRAKIYHSGAVLDACFSADGQHFITASADKTAKIFWHVNGVWRQKQSIQHAWPVLSVQLTADGKYLLTTCQDAWSLGLLQPLRRLKHGFYDQIIKSWSQPILSAEHRDIM